jgi:hypothetical protein
MKTATIVTLFFTLSVCPSVEQTSFADEGAGAAMAVSTPQGHPPSDAVVIFDGTSTDALVSHDGRPCHWPIRDGSLVASRQGGVWTKLKFRDAQVHVEFATPQRGAGNSGLYFHGLFEMQILNSRGGNVDKHSLGAVYGMYPPLASAGRAPGEWQTYDIIFTGPRRNAEGKVTSPGSITALLNGVLVQNHVEFREHVSPFTPLYRDQSSYVAELRAELMKTGTGPLHLQYHDAPVQFRNIWIRKLDKE